MTRKKRYTPIAALLSFLAVVIVFGQLYSPMSLFEYIGAILIFLAGATAERGLRRLYRRLRKNRESLSPGDPTIG